MCIRDRVDDFDVQYVDYLMPSVVQDKSNWKYPVTKYPEDGCIVFPYRRKAIARRGFSEAKFQNYLQDTFRGCDLLILLSLIHIYLEKREK